MPRGIHPVAIAAAALLAACDGLTVIPPPIPIAVGATGGALYIDFCTKDGREGGILLYRCTDETPTAVVSATIGAPFEVVTAGTSLTVVKANGAGKSTLVVDLRIKNGETRRVRAPFESRAIDSIEIQPRCMATATKPLPVATGTWVDATYVARGGGSHLGTSGAPLPLEAQDLTLGEWEGGAPGHAKYRTGTSPGTATITSPHDQSLAFAVDVVDRATVTVDWKPDLAGISANGISALVRPTAKTSTRSLCVIPGGAYTATVQSPGVCEVAHVPAPGQTELTWSTSATLPDAGNPELRVRGRASGSCNIEVRDQTGTFIKQLQLTVQP